MMRSALLTLVAFSALLTPSARAQFAEVYVTYNATHVSNVGVGALATSSGYVSQYTSFTSSGIGGGVTVNFFNLHFVKLGLDLRGSTKPGTPGLDTGMLGLKFTVQPPLLRLKPYVQVSGGYLGTRAVNVGTGSNGSTTYDHSAAYEVLGGVDYPLIHFIDLRVIEFGGGQGSVLLSSGSKVNFYTINTGLAFHF